MTDTLLEDTVRYPYFHATVPTDAFITKVLTALVKHFEWQKVAVLSTHDEQSVLVILGDSFTSVMICLST